MGEANKEIEKTLALIEKKFGKGSICYASKCKGVDVERVPTGSFSMDLEIGGGYPRGRIVELFGEESSGKTTMALKAVVEFQRLKLPCVWVDAEGVFDKPWAIANGVDLDSLLIVRKERAEENLSIAEAMLRSGVCGLIVIDSVAALMPMAEEEQSMEDPERIGDRAVMMNRFIRKVHSALNLKDEDTELPNKCLLLVINQTREKIGAYGDPTTTGGGRGLKFGASIRINFRRKDWIKEGSGDKERVVGTVIKGRSIKNKTFPPWRDWEFDFYNTDCIPFKKCDIDRVKEVINYGIYYNLIKQQGSYFSIGQDKFQGKEKLYEHFYKNTKDAVKIKAEIMEIALHI